jgi:hypothetical protein
MKQSRDPERSSLAKERRERVQTSSPIELEILKCIQDIEASNPKHHDSRQKKRSRLERAANRDPSAERSSGESQPQHEMRQ